MSRSLSADKHVTSLARKVAFLERPESYPSRPKGVETIETHMAWVFLTDTHAYKLKKPVRSAFLDFSTVEARRRDCEEEVRLNRRLASDVYLGTVPLTLDAGGRTALGGSGRTIDWLVKMRRLPQALMMDRRIADGTVTEEEVRRAGRLLAAFYRNASRVSSSPAEYLDSFDSDIHSSAGELASPRYGLPATPVRETASALLQRREELAAELRRRANDGRIVEGHGDLRPEHICLEPRPIIIDCLEFNRNLRLLDPVDDLGFLCVECERLGARWVGDTLLQVYQETTGDQSGMVLVDFYMSHRAFLRAKIAVWHLNDPDVQDPPHWVGKAQTYLRLARDHLRLGRQEPDQASISSTIEPPE